MNTMLSNKVCLLLSLTAVTVLSSAISAQAEEKKAADASTTTPLSSQGWESVASKPLSESGVTPDANIASLAVNDGDKLTQEANSGLINVQSVKPTETSAAELTKTVKYADASQLAQPVPGTVPNSAAMLKTEAIPQNTSITKDSTVAQSDINITPGRATRAGSSYLGVAGNIGIGGDTAVGSGNIAVISKIGLTRTFSVRPAAIIGDETVLLVPLTYDFSLERSTEPIEPARFAPYVGAGVAINIGDDSAVGFLASAGVDVPLTPQLTATAGLNANFKSETDVGLLIGVGYNFNGL